jgi:hypothetical protein
LKFWNVHLASLDGIDAINLKTLIIQNCSLPVSELLKVEILHQKKPEVQISLPELRTEHCQNEDVQSMLRRNRLKYIQLQIFSLVTYRLNY